MAVGTCQKPDEYCPTLPRAIPVPTTGLAALECNSEIREELPTIRPEHPLPSSATPTDGRMLSRPWGFLQATLASGTDAEPARDAMIEWRKQGEAALKKRAQQAQRDGDLDKKTNPSDFAHYLSMLMSGLGIQAANGATKTELKRYAEMALRFLGY